MRFFKWGGNAGLNETTFPPVETVKIIQVYEAAPYMNADFLRQKYCTERLSTSQIAALCFSSRSTILKHLEQHGIARRKSGSSLRRPGYGLAYGRRVVGRLEVRSKKEEVIITRMRAMKLSGLSYGRIAERLNQSEVPTKTKRGLWSAKTVHQIVSK